MTTKSSAFVFVVCGADEHIHTLNFSLKALKRYSQHPIVVVTDTSRNQLAIEHDNILDQPTPEHYNHHQASIYLKTGLHRWLDPKPGHRYCYLDTDVVALNGEVNQIFDHYQPPVTFCTDHCKMPTFSPHAVHCDCLQVKGKKATQLQELIDRYEQQYLDNPDFKAHTKTVNELVRRWQQELSDAIGTEEAFESSLAFHQAKDWWFNLRLTHQPGLLEKRDRLIQLTDRNRHSLPVLAFNYLFKVLPRYRKNWRLNQWKDKDGHVLIDEGTNYFAFMAEKGFTYNRETGTWYDEQGHRIHDELPLHLLFNNWFAGHGLKYDHERDAWLTLDGELYCPNVTKMIERNSAFRWDEVGNRWIDEEGNPVFSLSCDHLQQQIMATFGVDVQDANWQHWNGGVFLFGNESRAFMDTWHQWSLQVFDDKQWTTRDQGTLIATVWHYGLQDHPVLPVTFNFIADYFHPTMQYKGQLTFDIDAGRTGIRPNFIHIYHHWGDTNWPVWRDVEEHITQQPV